MSENKSQKPSQSSTPTAAAKEAATPEQPKQAEAPSQEEAPTEFQGSESGNVFPIDWKKHFVVEMWQEKFFESGFVEVPNTRQTQTFAPHIYKNLTTENKEGKTWFQEGDWKIKLHHDPTKA
jgi:hypothetical protein